MTYRKISGSFAAAGAFLAAMLALSAAQVSPQAPSANSAHAGHEGMDMSAPMDGHTQSAMQQAILAQNKKESEFNHHLAGFLVILAGLFLLGEAKLRQRWPSTRFAWPVCFLVCGLFLLVYSDTELWPFGPQSWWYGLTHNLEDLQHKTFAVILLALGIFEFQRARGILKSAWAKWLSPVLACCGSGMLLFHEHHRGMHGSEHMMAMARIQAEHQNFAATGLGIGVFKGLSELPTRLQALFTKLWSLLMVVLGVLLMLYTE